MKPIAAFGDELEVLGHRHNRYAALIKALLKGQEF